MDPSAKKPYKVTIHDVAEAAGTSASTVSRVLTGRARVRETKRTAVLKAIEELGYTPNMLARGLKTRITYTLGLILSDIQSPFLSAAAKGAQDYAAQKGYSILLCDTSESSDKQELCFDMLWAKKVDGVIWVPAADAADLVKNLLLHAIHLVLIDRQVDGLPFSSVVVNDEEASFQAVQHLVASGYHRIAILTVQRSVSSHERRLQGYCRALTASGIDICPSFILRGESSYESGYRLTMHALTMRPLPQALFATSSRLGVGVLQALHEENVRLQRDMGLVVFDDIPAFALMHPSITAVRQPGYEIGYKAAQLLIQSIESDEPSAPEEVILPAELVVRESSVPLA